jgi:hypothetical protein
MHNATIMRLRMYITPPEAISTTYITILSSWKKYSKYYLKSWFDRDETLYAYHVIWDHLSSVIHKSPQSIRNQHWSHAHFILYWLNFAYVLKFYFNVVSDTQITVKGKETISSCHNFLLNQKLLRHVDRCSEGYMCRTWRILTMVYNTSELPGSWTLSFVWNSKFY